MGWGASLITAGLLFGQPVFAQGQDGFGAIGFVVRESAPITGLGQGFGSRLWTLGRARTTGADFRLVSVLVDATYANASIRSVERQGRARDLFVPGLCLEATIATNGGFYIRDGSKARPLGLVRVAIRTLSKPSGRRFGGFLAIDNGRLRVLTRSKGAEAVKASHAIESSPIVVESGRSGIRSDDGVRFDRIAIGTTKAGRTIVIGAFGDDQDTVTLAEFAELTILAVALQGDNAQHVLALDGGPSAHLYIPSVKTLFGQQSGLYLPNAVCVGEKRD